MHIASASEVFDLLRDDLAAVEREFGAQSQSPIDVVTDIATYLLAGGGKRIRPLLLLLSARALGCTDEARIRLGAVVEMLHTATLVHDDIIDEASTRRGRPSSNTTWGNAKCVLAGDWLYMQAFQIALRQRNFRVLDVLISLTQMMVEGEMLQLERLHRVDISEADYMELVDRKTASLFSACASLGAIAADAGEAAEAKLADFAWNLGMAFQLVDDILDTTSNEKTLGKPAGSDLREGKMTLPVIYAFERASPEERKAIEQVLTEGNHDQVPFAEILAAIKRHGGIERAYERAHSFTEKSRSILLNFPESPAQRALLAIVDLVTERDS